MASNCTVCKRSSRRLSNRIRSGLSGGQIVFSNSGSASSAIRWSNSGWNSPPVSELPVRHLLPNSSEQGRKALYGSSGIVKWAVLCLCLGLKRLLQSAIAFNATFRHYPREDTYGEGRGVCPGLPHDLIMRKNVPARPEGNLNRSSCSWAALFYCTETVTPLWLPLVPTETDIGRLPDGIFVGIWTLSCITPDTKAGASP